MLVTIAPFLTGFLTIVLYLLVVLWVSQVTVQRAPFD